MISRRAVSSAAALLLALGLAACANPSGIAPQAQLLDATALNLAAAEPAQPLATDWWLAFGDPQLDALIGQALAGNPNLRVAQAR
ncbi:MAG: RND transporter, partial [Comamonadaceae bacterium]